MLDPRGPHRCMTNMQVMDVYTRLSSVCRGCATPGIGWQSPPSITNHHDVGVGSMVNPPVRSAPRRA